MLQIETLDDVRIGRHRLEAICRNTNCRYCQELDVDRLVQRIGGRHFLIPDRTQIHFSDRMRCPSCKRRGMNLWLRPRAQQAKAIEAGKPRLPNFTVVDEGPAPFKGDSVIATADNLMVGRGAFAAAGLFYADHRIVLKQGAFVLADSKDGKPIVPMTREQFEDMRKGELEMGTRVIPPLLPKAG